MRSSLEESNSDLANFPNFGNLYAIFRAVGASIIEQDAQLESINSNLFLLSANGDALDAKAKEFNISRKLGTFSTGTIIILGSTTIIPAGTILTDNQTGLQFSIENNINSVVGKGRGTIICNEYTNLGNLSAGTELYSSIFPSLKFIVGNSFDPLTSSYTGSLIGGSGREDDDALKSRIINTLQSLSLSTIKALELAALNINGINKVVIEENVPSLGYITIYINNNESRLLDLVKAELDLVKPVGTALQIKIFKEVPLNLNLKITTLSNINTVNLNNFIIGKAQEYISNLSNQSLFTKEGLASYILQIENIINIEVISPSTNIEIKANEILTLNTTNISYT